MAHSTRPKSADCYHAYGVRPSTLRYVMEHVFSLTHFHDCMDTYYLKYWSANYLLSQTQGGVIRADNRLYHVVYSRGLTRGKMLLAPPSQQYALSFRSAHADFELPAIVLISESGKDC